MDIYLESKNDANKINIYNRLKNEIRVRGICFSVNFWWAQFMSLIANLFYEATKRTGRWLKGSISAHVRKGTLACSTLQITTQLSI